MKKILIFILFLALTVEVHSQHFNQYSQYMFNGLVINPAYAGASNVLNITMEHRNQWTGFDGNPKTTSLSAHSPLRNKKLNVGLEFISDRYGATQKNSISAIYAYRIHFPSSSLSFGLQGGVEMTTNNWSEIQTTTPGDQAFIGQQKYATPQAGFGIYYQSENFYSGISSPSLIRYNNLYQNTFSPFFFTSGYLFKMNGDFVFKPSIMVKYLKDSPVQFDFNLNSYYKQFGLGFSYRRNDAIVFLLQYSLNEQLSAGYSYDLTISKLRTYTRGSHEIMLKYEFGYKLNVKNPRYF